MLSNSAPVTPIGRSREVQLQLASFTSGAKPRKKVLQQQVSPSSSASTPISLLDSIKSLSPPSKATTPASERLDQSIFRKSLADIAENWRLNSKRTGMDVNQTCSDELHSRLHRPSVSIPPSGTVYYTLRLLYALDLSLSTFPSRLCPRASSDIRGSSRSLFYRGAPQGPEVTKPHSISMASSSAV